jgi:hypothetical protein
MRKKRLDLLPNWINLDWNYLFLFKSCGKGGELTAKSITFGLELSLFFSKGCGKGVKFTAKLDTFGLELSVSFQKLRKRR